MLRIARLSGGCAWPVKKRKTGSICRKWLGEWVQAALGQEAEREKGETITKVKGKRCSTRTDHRRLYRLTHVCCCKLLTRAVHRKSLTLLTAAWTGYRESHFFKACRKLEWIWEQDHFIFKGVHCYFFHPDSEISSSLLTSCLLLHLELAGNKFQHAVLLQFGSMG